MLSFLANGLVDFSMLHSSDGGTAGTETCHQNFRPAEKKIIRGKDIGHRLRSVGRAEKVEKSKRYHP